jgi:hypothetical protein
MNRQLEFALAAAVVLFTAPGFAGDILFVSDTTTDLDIAVALAADGHAVTVVADDHATGNLTLKGDLSGYVAVFWSTSQVAHDDPELLGILSSWVAGGGRLFVTGADGVIASYNPDSSFHDFLGVDSGWDGGYQMTAIADVANSITRGVIDIRGVVPPDPGDSDSVCGPLAPGVVGLASPTSGSNPCPGGEAYTWILRSLGSGEIAWVESGNFTSTVPPDEPLWTDTSLSTWGAYNGAIRNFAAGYGVFSDGFDSGDTAAWSATVP